MEVNYQTTLSDWLTPVSVHAHHCSAVSVTSAAQQRYMSPVLDRFGGAEPEPEDGQVLGGRAGGTGQDTATRLLKKIKLSDWFAVLPLLRMRSSSIDGLSVFSDIAKTAKIELVTNKLELSQLEYNLLLIST